MTSSMLTPRWLATDLVTDSGAVAVSPRMVATPSLSRRIYRSIIVSLNRFEYWFTLQSLR